MNFRTVSKIEIPVAWFLCVQRAAPFIGHLKILCQLLFLTRKTIRFIDLYLFSQHLTNFHNVFDRDVTIAVHISHRAFVRR